MTDEIRPPDITATIMDLVARLDDEAPVLETAPVAALQPIVHLEADVVIGYEALARFEDGLGADHHFALAAAEGRLTQLELACCEAALARLGELPGHAFVSMNASAACLTASQMPEMLRRVDPTRVVIEVTQQSPVEDGSVLEHHLAAVRRTGVRVGIDDLGGADFSIERIAQSSPAVVKASPRLVADCDRDEERQRALSQVAELGRRVGALSIGVGVERPEEADVLGRLGFDAAQGYLFGKPQIDLI